MATAAGITVAGITITGTTIVGITIGIAAGIAAGIVVWDVERAFIACRVLIVCRTEIGNPGTDVGVWKGIEFGIQLTLVLNRAVWLIQSRIGEIRRLTAAGNDGGYEQRSRKECKFFHVLYAGGLKTGFR